MTIKELKELKANKDKYIEDKKGNIYKGIDKGVAVPLSKSYISKIVATNKDINTSDDSYYFVVNTSGILDNHNDVHLDKCWESTLEKTKGNVYLLTDHNKSIKSVVALKSDIRVFTATIPFSAIGKDIEGETYALIYEVKKDDIVSDDMRKLIDNSDFECSVRMMYLDIELAINSEEEEFKVEKHFFDKYKDQILNVEDKDSLHFFWAVKEAENVEESSIVLFGSNSATGVVVPTTDPIKEIVVVEPEVVKEHIINLNIY